MDKSYDRLDWNFMKNCIINIGFVKDGLVELCNA